MGNGCIKHFIITRPDARVSPIAPAPNFLETTKKRLENLHENGASITKSLGVNAWIKERLESVKAQNSPATLRKKFRKLKKRRSTFITVEGVQYKVCMQRAQKLEKDEENPSFMTSIEALKGSSIEDENMSDFETRGAYAALSQAAGRLRGIIALVNSGYLTVDILLNNLEASARTLEALYAVEMGHDHEDASVFSECGTAGEFNALRRISETAEIPSEVKNWLVGTFCRTEITKANEGNKKKFKVLVTGIQAASFLEKIFKTRHMNYPKDLVKSLSLIDKWEFNVFDVSDASKQRPLTYVLYELLKKYDLLSTFKIPTNVLMSFADKVDAGYRKHRNPYHNPNHAADVAQTTHFFICQTGLLNWLSEVEVFAMIFAAAIHDYEHTGTTNTFHTQTRSPLAVLYNDRSVLENHHVAASFKMLQDNKGSNIVAELTPDQFEEFRSLVVDIVLATDMSQHFQQMSQVTDALNNPKELDKVKVMALIVHLADISHAAKCWELHERWSYALTEEYFRQGDREKELGLPCSTLCDRNTVMVPQSQFGFLRFIIEPSFNTLIELFRHIADHYIAKEDAALNSADVAEKAEGSPKRTRRHIVKCRLGTSQDQGDALYPDYTYANVVARLEESGKKWIGNIESNRKKWSALAEKEKATASPKDENNKDSSTTDSTKNASSDSVDNKNENSNNNKKERNSDSRKSETSTKVTAKENEN